MSAWSGILSLSFKYRPYYIVLEDQTGHIRAALPFMFIQSLLTGKRIVSLPRIPYCDPLIDGQEELSLIKEHVVRMVDEGFIQYAELKTQYNEMSWETVHFKSYVPFKNHVLELDKNEQEIWKGIQRGSIRQPILRAQRNKVKVMEGTDEADLIKFYRLYSNITNHHIIPKRPYSYFLNIWKILTKEDAVRILIAEKDKNALAASLVFVFKDRMHLEFLGIDYDSLDSGAAQLLVWEAIQFAYQKDLNFFDFGLTASDNEGLAQYKRKWGCLERDVKYFYYPDAVGYKSYVKRATRGGKSLFFPQYLKKRIGKAIGTVFFRHFG